MAWTTTTDRTTGYVVTAADWNVAEDDLAFLYGDVAWTAATLAGAWVDFAGSGGTSPVGFRKIGTRVALRGAVKSGTINTTAFTLPTGYRPLFNINFPCDSNGAFGHLTITSAGVVTPVSGSNVWFSIDGITFDTI